MTEERPKLRNLNVSAAVRGGRSGVLLSDPLKLSDKVMFVPSPLSYVLGHMNGRRTLRELAVALQLRTGYILPLSAIEELVRELDEALFLENERFLAAYRRALEDYRRAPTRELAFAGESYPEDPGELEEMFRNLMPEEEEAPPLRARGLITPHIDFQRGGRVYGRTWAAARKALEGAELFVILGIDHHSEGADFTLTLKDFRTPWGVAPAARDEILMLGEVLGEEAFRDELHHRSEHSVEFALLWLHYLKRDIKILPVLCGSFQRFLEAGRDPQEDPKIGKFIEALRALPPSTFLVAAGDLSHVGPAFGDALPLGLLEKVKIKSFDEELMKIICEGEARDLFLKMKAEGMEKKVCGFPAFYILKAVLEGSKGIKVDYEQCPADERGTSVVSVCGMLLGYPQD